MDADDEAAQALAAEPSAAVGSAGTDLDMALLAVVLERGYERRDQPFALSSGGYSRDYVDLRRAVARGPDLDVAARALLSRLAARGIGFDVIGGMTMGADPVAHAVALISGKAWFSVRKAAKDHGRQQRVEGASLEPGVRAVVMEDTVSTGRSILEAYDVVASTGASIVAVCTLLDRGGDIGQMMAERGTPYIALLGHRDLGIDPVLPASA